MNTFTPQQLVVSRRQKTANKADFPGAAVIGSCGSLSALRTVHSSRASLRPSGSFRRSGESVANSRTDRHPEREPGMALPV